MSRITISAQRGADLAAILIRQAVLAEGGITRPPVLHADNGGQMKGATMEVTMEVTMEKLGITASCSRYRVSNDNPFSEAVFRTCRYRPDWPSKGVAAKAAAQAPVKSFVKRYNGAYLHSAIHVVTPDARHAGHDLREQAVPRTAIPEDIPLDPGTQLQGQVMPVAVVEVTNEQVVLDATHPLAGKDLTFAIELVEIP